MADLPELPADAQARIKATEAAAEAILKIYRAEGNNSVAEAYRGSAGDLDFEPASARFGWQEARYYYQQGRIDAAERVSTRHFARWGGAHWGDSLHCIRCLPGLPFSRRMSL